MRLLPTSRKESINHLYNVRLRADGNVSLSNTCHRALPGRAPVCRRLDQDPLSHAYRFAESIAMTREQTSHPGHRHQESAVARSPTSLDTRGTYHMPKSVRFLDEFINPFLSFALPPPPPAFFRPFARRPGGTRNSVNSVNSVKSRAHNAQGENEEHSITPCSPWRCNPAWQPRACMHGWVMRNPSNVPVLSKHEITSRPLLGTLYGPPQT